MATELPTQILALGRDLERTQRQVTALESLLHQLAADVQALAPTAEDATAETADDRSWLLLVDPEQARGVLADLTGWLARVYLHYPDSALASCWLWHPGVIEELWWLRQAHADAYSARHGSPAKAADWHDRHRPGVTGRINTALRACDLAQHDRPRPAPAAPLGRSATHVADTWTTSRISPIPTPDEFTEAEEHDKQQHHTNHR